MRKPNNIIGMRFGEVEVIGYVGPDRPDHPKMKLHRWSCRCSCGRDFSVLGNSLTSGNMTSCGCKKSEKLKKPRRDLTGKTFGFLTVLSYSGKSYWLCVCSCGNETSVLAGNLKTGKSKSCGCKQGNYIHGLWGKSGYKEYYLADPVKKLRHGIGRSVRSALKSRNGSKCGKSVFDCLPYTPQDLKEHLESLWEPWMNWDNYGGKNNCPDRTWHIDHVKPQSAFKFSRMEDPTFLECWSLENIRPLEKIANIKKGSRTE